MNTHHKPLRSAKVFLLGSLLALSGLPAQAQEVRSPQQQDLLLNKLTSVVNSQNQLIQQLQDQMQQKAQQGKTPPRQGLTSEVLFGRLSAPAAVPPDRVAGNLYQALYERTPYQPGLGEEADAPPYARLNQPHSKFSIPGVGEILLWCYKQGQYLSNGNIETYSVFPDNTYTGALSFYAFRNRTNQTLAITGPAGGQMGNGMIPPDAVSPNVNSYSIINPAIFNSPYKAISISIQSMELFHSYRPPLDSTFVTDVSGMNQNTCRAYVTVTTTTETP